MTQLYYKEKGQGEPLILLHGNGENHEYFRNQIEYFSKSYRVIALDTRGHGKSPRGDEPFTIRQFAEDLREFMDEKKIEKAILLGFSDGGNIALIFALRYPQRVSRLILNGANLYGSGVRPSVQIPIILGYHIARLFAGHSLKARRNAEMLRLMVKDPDIKPEELKAVAIKTLVIVGTKDMIKAQHTALIKENLPNASLRILSGDHFIAAKNPKKFNQAVEEFLKQPD
ncbi:alpha/beta hydrolase [Blautia sp. An249]|uniref:alpha/beta fold hydrolase n=1 Tax=Blautia sp. An249 TaxID=1965603 RepID=UPI000B38E3A7|nr:alpha/beta hydrolase [Blautia sp. An249]OUO81243.1 alpha/beta hydrolase [Blautia sp. An249]